LRNTAYSSGINITGVNTESILFLSSWICAVPIFTGFGESQTSLQVATTLLHRTDWKWTHFDIEYPGHYMKNLTPSNSAIQAINKSIDKLNNFSNKRTKTPKNKGGIG
jgi:hypothetical protein